MLLGHGSLWGLGLGLVAFLFVALRFAPWALTRVWASSRFSGISSCGGLAWPCGPSFPCILLLWGSASGAPQIAKNGPFAQRPYNGFISAVTGSILQFLAFWAFVSLHFGLVGLHFLVFWPCGPSFPCFRGQLLGPPPHVAKNYPFAQRPYNGFISAVTGPILQFLAFWALGFHFFAFWPCGRSFPCILAL